MRRSRRRRDEDSSDEIDARTRYRTVPSSDPTSKSAADMNLSALEDPARVSHLLRLMDPTMRARAIQALQRDRGNAFVRSVISAGVGSPLAASSGGRRGGGIGRGETVTLEREAEGEAEPADVSEVELAADIPEGATEEVGPTTSSSYPVSAVSLADTANQLSSRDEAGYCGWKEAWTYKTGPAGRITAVKVTVKIDIEMPAWTPPPSMLPRAKAEWERAYQALLAHEQGHEKLVHDHFDGLADKILGKTPRQGTLLFNGAKANLAAASRAYDGRTGHGTKTGTVIDTAIEQKELDEKKRQDQEKAKAGRKAETETAEGSEPAQAPA